jgi:hypothetical protein
MGGGCGHLTLSSPIIELLANEVKSGNIINMTVVAV